jgi:hypothetical protein
MGATYLPLSAVTDPRVTVYASRADYVTRNGGDPVNNQPPMFDPTQSVCMWSGPAGSYVVPRQGATNNVVLLNEATPVVPNIPGSFNWPPAPPIAPTNMTYQYPNYPPMPVDPSTLCLQAQAVALASRILKDTGLSLTPAEQPAPTNYAPTQITAVYNYADETRRVWNLVGSVAASGAAPSAPAAAVSFNAAALLAQESRLGVGYPGTWSLTGQLLEWLPGNNNQLPTAQTPPDLDTPIVLTPTQSVVLLPPMMVLMVMDIAGAASSGGGSDSATLQQLLGLLQTVHADVQKIGADLGDKTLA